MANTHMKKFSASLIVSEMQINNARQHLTPIRMVITKKQEQQVLAGCREIGTLAHSWWECKMVQPLWKKYGGSSKN